MSQRYKGAVISATPPTVNANGYGTAKGVWTLQQQMQYEGGGTWPSPFTPNYVEDVFSNYLFTGNGTNQTITNNINLLDNGGLVWTKGRNIGTSHYLFDTARGSNYWLASNSVSGNQFNNNNTNGFAYGSGKYVVATVLGLLSSSDGITWSEITGNTSGLSWGNVQYLNNRFIATAGSRKQVALSTDGVTWTIVNITCSTNFDNQVYFANDRFLLSAFYTTFTLVSADNGLTWTEGSIGSVGNGPYYYVGSVGNYFVTAGGNSTDKFTWSSDGLNWAQASTQFNTGTTGWYSNPNAPNILIAQTGYTKLIYTTNGTTWNTALDSGGDYWFARIAYAHTQNLFFLYRVGFAGGSSNAYTSSSGTSWSTVGIPSGPSQTYPLGTDGTRFYIGDAGGTSYWYSSTGSSGSWTSGTAPISPVNTYFQAGDRIFISGTSQFASSSNATSWSTQSIASVPAINFLNNGFEIKSTGNTNTYNFDSWTFRKQPKFFDVVTYTGTGVARDVSHNLGSVPGFMVVKRLDLSYGWYARHKDLASNGYIVRLDTNEPQANAGLIWRNQSPTSTTFPLGTDIEVNANGGSYVAYLFANSAGGFGETNSDSVISCGSFVTGAMGKISAPVNCGFEVQWLMVKNTGANENWQIYDNMRGMSYNGYNVLYPNTADVEYSSASAIVPTAIGFDTPNSNGPFASYANYIYVAIRRGPMKPPTSGTQVFSANYSSSTTGQQLITGFSIDSQIQRYLPSGIGGYWFDRLRGVSTTTSESGSALYPNNTNNETSEPYTRFFNNTGYQQNSGFPVGIQMINYSFSRTPGFMDVVCYKGTGGSQTIYHNLGVIPELMIWKRQSGGSSYWIVGTQFGASNFWLLYLNDPYGSSPPTTSYTGSGQLTGAPTSTSWGVTSSSPEANESGSTYVTYLFATCPGVSKVGSYTGTGTTQQINCGFTSGARFVMIKRADANGDWYIWDSVRGIVEGNDPYLLINNTSAQVTNTDYVDTYAQGFEISSTAPAAINANGGTFIYLAIA